jgi:hypothetical protein
MTSSQNFYDANILYTEHKQIIEKEWPLFHEGLTFYSTHLLSQHIDFLTLASDDLTTRTKQLFGYLPTPSILETSATTAYQ